MLRALFQRWRRRWQAKRYRRPTLLLRCILIIAAELLANALLWVVAAIVFRHRTRFLTLCLLSWTLGLRHALDADHISVIDNATRRIVSTTYTLKQGSKAIQRARRPVTCGLWFSLGHSTIVVSVICAIAISLGVVDRLGGVSSVGGIVGASVSGSTLFLFAVINSILLARSIAYANKHGRSSQTQLQNQERTNAAEEPDEAAADKGDVEVPPAPALDPPEDRRFKGIFTRLAYPLFRLVDRPYKLYPIGVLFGLGFDTASSIALLGIAGATNSTVPDKDLGGSNLLSQEEGNQSDASIILLALLFTAGMTLVDSLDSVLMINAYAPGELLAPRVKGKGWRKRIRFLETVHAPSKEADEVAAIQPTGDAENADKGSCDDQDLESQAVSTSTTLSHVLTLLSILLAFAISIITLMGLIGENCGRCARAAAKEEETRDGGLEGRWWMFWQQANDASGIIGACIVGGFAAILVIWYSTKAGLKFYHRYRSSVPTLYLHTSGTISQA